MGIPHPLPRSAPEEQGVSSGAILAFLEAVEQEAIELHSLMLLRHGQVVAEGWWTPYGPEYPHMLFSLSKSFTSTAVGLAVAEGRLTVDDPVLSFFPEDVPPEVNEHLKAMRVRHLLSMSTGQEGALSLGLLEQLPGNWVQVFLAWLPKEAPGTQFLYNSGASYLLSAIVQRVTGETLLHYLQTRLFAPLGIENATWESCPRGINTGGWGLSIKTEDIARFGQLYLQKVERLSKEDSSMVTVHSVLEFLTGLAGFVLALAITAAIIWFIRAPLGRVLQVLIGDKVVAEAGSFFVLILLGLYGLRAALNYITQANLSLLFRGLTGLLVDLAGVIQWVIYIAALLFIGYSLQARQSEAGKEQE